MEQLPKVSVCMITYNHEKFIEEAINGVLMQECNFEIELIIANDCSPDKTEVVIQNILKTHPRASIINYIKHEKNIGMMPNFIFALQQGKGKYIALCEGDDYWTDPLKLQKQVDVLEINSEFVICYTSNSKLMPNDKIVESNKSSNVEKTTFKELIRGNYIATLTVVFRRNKINNLPQWFSQLAIGDWPLYLFLLKDGGYVYFLNENTSTYRAEIGVSENFRKNPTKLNEIISEILIHMENDLRFLKFRNEIKTEIKQNTIRKFSIYNRNKKYLDAFKIWIGLWVKNPSFGLFKFYLYSLKISLIKKYNCKVKYFN